MNRPSISSTVAVAALIAAGTHLAPAQAEDSPHSLKANVALTSNYYFRGISQTNNGPAIQGGFDYTYVPWSLYAGVWGSNVDSSSGSGYYAVEQDGNLIAVSPDDPDAFYVPVNLPGYSGASMELDFKVGWAPTFGKLGLDLGYVRYQYPRTKVSANNTDEYHIGVSYDVMGWFTPKFVANYSPDFYGFSEAWYYDLSVTVPLPWELSLTGHYGWTRYNNSVPNGGAPNYEDYSVSLGREVYAGVVLTAAWVSRSDTELCAPPFQCGSSAVVTLSKSF